LTGLENRRAMRTPRDVREALPAPFASVAPGERPFFPLRMPSATPRWGIELFSELLGAAGWLDFSCPFRIPNPF
jgi:hypothetical protein